MRDVNGARLMPRTAITLAVEIEMERLFVGYDAALAGAPVPHDLSVGNLGRILSIEDDGEPMGLVEFTDGAKAYWRGLLKGHEMRLAEGAG